MNEHVKPGDVVIWKFWSSDLGFLEPRPGVALFRTKDGKIGVAYCTTDKLHRYRDWCIPVRGAGLRNGSLIRVDRVDVRKPEEHVPVAGKLPAEVFKNVMMLRDNFDMIRKKKT